MIIPKVRFNIDDVVRVHESEDKDNSHLLHKLCSPFAILLNNSRELIFYSDVRLLEKPSRAYIANTYNLTKHLNSNTREIISDNTADNIHKLSKEYISNLNQLIHFYPTSEEIAKFSEISEHQKELLLMIDAETGILIYNANKIFSKDEKNSHYYFSSNSEFFYTAIEYLLKSNIIFTYKDITKFLTSDDLANEIVAPLVLNASYHAFKSSPPKQKHITISGQPNPANKTYRITVIDNGSGIDENILPYILKEQITTKTDNYTEHGIGLMSVIKVVKKNRGTISVNSIPKKGTTFTIDLPYSAIINDTCIQ